MGTLRLALSCIQGPVDTHSHVPQQCSPYQAEDKQAAGLPVASAHLEARKELGKHFICSRLETHPTRPGNLALAPEWGLCMPPPPSRPGCGYRDGGGGEASHTMSLAKRQGPLSHPVPGPCQGPGWSPSDWRSPLHPHPLHI